MSPLLRRRPAGGRGSTALVTVLALVTLMTLFLVAYINLMKVDRQITRNYAQGLKAGEAGRGAVDYIIGQLRAEMASGTVPLAVGSYSLYTNVTSANIQPGGIATNAALPALLKMSSPGLGVYGAAAAPNVAVGSASSATSANGRSINTGRWAKPGLGTPATSPSWYLIGTQGVTNAVSSSVQGRFAYAVYDLGSLLDVNVAGYPSTLNTAQQTAIRGSLAALDIGTLPGLNQASADALIRNFRNRTSAATPDSYTNQVISVASTNGFLRVSPGDDTFLSRQDFLAYAKANGLGGATTNFTTFSRTLNSPSWSPATNAGTVTVQTVTRTTIVNMDQNYVAGAAISSSALDYNYQANANQAASVNRSFLSQPATAAFARLDGTQAVAGEPLVAERFPLDRLAWLSYQGPSAQAIAQFGSAAAATAKIKQAFGLVWDSTNRLWVYTSPSSAHGGGSYVSGNSDGPASGGLAASTVKTLAVVASENREPDFFELLKAGILQGSLGVRSSINGTAYTVQPGEITPEGNVLQIGANIIDQYDTDDYPTVIRAYMPVVMRIHNAFTLGYGYGTGSTALTPTDFAGVENLPYLATMRLRVYRPELPPGGTGTGTASEYNLPGRPNVQASLLPQFWNPHQNAATPSAVRPANFRLIQTFGNIRVTLEPTVGAGSTASNPTALNCFTSPASEWPSTELATPLPQPMIEFGGGMTFAAPGFLKPADVVATSVPQNVRPALSHDTQAAGFVGFWLGEASGAGNTPYDKNIWASFGGVPSAPAAVPFDASQVCNLPDNTVDIQPTPLPATDPFWKGDTLLASKFSQRFPVIELQYQDGAVWKTYQRFDGVMAVVMKTPDSYGSYSSFTGEFHEQILGRIDPRGSRLGLTDMSDNSSLWKGNPAFYSVPVAGSWQSRGPSGEAVITGSSGTPNGNQSGAQFSSEFDPNNYNIYYQYWQYMYNAVGGQYYTDNDHVLRRGDNKYTAASMNPLVPNASAQPIMLNRPFTSVGDLGYVFRDLPFKTLDLFSANSADAGLLDLFCLHASPRVVAGTVNLNGGNAKVMAQILTGGVITEADGGALSAAQGTSIGTALVTASRAAPFTGSWDLPAFLANMTYLTSVSGNMQKTKTQMEAVPRQLAGVTDTRCWNLLIDVVAQAGRYPTGASNPDQFVVEGECRYWLQVAIDRRTGKVIDQQLEPVFQ